MRRLRLAILIALLAACRGESRAHTRAIIVFNAGSLAVPLRAAVDSFAALTHVRVEQENAGSLETARKLTELHKIPDLIALADYEVFPQLLMPEQVRWYAQFARNRMVIAFTDKSRHASEIDSTSWYRILARPEVQVGRANPDLDPNGYRTLLTLQLAERYYRQPGLAARLLAAWAARNVRPKEADLVGLLQAGELDYIWSYESIAQAAHLRFVTLPEQIDLGSPADSAYYAQAVVRVAGKTPRDTLTIRGQPIVYGFSVPLRAPHPELALHLAAFLCTDDGRRILRAAQLDVLDRPIFVGTDVPAPLADLGTMR